MNRLMESYPAQQSSQSALQLLPSQPSLITTVNPHSSQQSLRTSHHFQIIQSPQQFTSHHASPSLSNITIPSTQLPRAQHAQRAADHSSNVAQNVELDTNAFRHGSHSQNVPFHRGSASLNAQDVEHDLNASHHGSHSQNVPYSITVLLRQM